MRSNQRCIAQRSVSGVDPLAERRRPDDVGEHDRHDLAPLLDGGAVASREPQAGQNRARSGADSPQRPHGFTAQQ